MALTITVTKKSVEKMDTGQFTITWQAEMSAEITKYKAEQNIYSAVALTNAVATLNTNLAG